MRLSRYFLPTLKEAPSDAQIVSHQLMLRAGLIRQEAAGIYAWLPLGLRVLKKIEQIVREEMDRAGAVELLMPTLQLADLWRESGRYDDYGQEMLRITDRHERELLYGPTTEEMITDIFRGLREDRYKDLPLNLYHIQWKFRDERRPRFGVMRGREFLMKDAYSLRHRRGRGAQASYNRMFVAYLNTFARMGLKAVPMRADTGPIGGDLSHEFIVLADTGESQVFCDRDLVEMPAPGPDVDWDDLQPIVDAAHRALRRHRGDARRRPASRAETRRGRPADRARHRGRPHLLLRRQILQADEGQGRRARRHGHGRSTWAATASASRACWAPSSRPATTTSGIIWPDAVAPFDVGVINLRAGDAAVRRGLRGGLRRL